MLGLGQGSIQGGQIGALHLDGLAGRDQLAEDRLDALFPGLHQGCPLRFATHQQGTVLDHFGREVLGDLEDVGLMVGGGLGGGLMQFGDFTLEGLDLLTRRLELLLEVGLGGLGLGAQAGEVGRLFGLLGLGLGLEAASWALAAWSRSPLRADSRALCWSMAVANCSWNWPPGPGVGQWRRPTLPCRPACAIWEAVRASPLARIST